MKLLRYVLYLAAGMVFLSLGSCVLLSKRLPEGPAGAEADALARDIEVAVNKAAWERTGAVAWTFRGRNRHVWDKKRHYSQVSWGEGEGEVIVQFPIDQRERGIVSRGGQPVTGDEARKLIDKGYAAWINDSFWLNPLVKLFDPGTIRKALPPEEGHRRLLLQYTSGGLTPGDSYLYTLGPDNVPIRWQMWVSIIPIKGLAASWDGWITLSTGAKVSTRHELGPLMLELTDVKGAETIEALVGRDLFAGMESASKP